ncbi:MAG: T9SS type A sorting domain-containing protein [Bacteroidales bacterium]|nr:T9SS type A sorting domain-containing protein [Bacteroidales bacterium]
MKKKYVLLLICLFIASALLAQAPLARTYDYDASGNRVLRKTITMRSLETTTPDTAYNREREYCKMEDPNIFSDNVCKQDVRIFPNPTSGMLTLMFDRPLGNGYYRVFSLSGKILLEGNLSQNTKMDLSSLPGGTYLIRITLDNDSETWKIIKL